MLLTARVVKEWDSSILLSEVRRLEAILVLEPLVRGLSLTLSLILLAQSDHS